MSNRNSGWLLLLAPFLIASTAYTADTPSFPRGFFVQDLSTTPPAPAFYDLEAHRLKPFAFQKSYEDFIDVFWDRTHGKVFFSARVNAHEPYRVYVKDWPDGDERAVYENPLGPFRFLLSPDGERLALQVMGARTWPTLAVHAWRAEHTTVLGEGYSPDWSADGQRLLFLKIPGSLPSVLYEYRVDTDTATALLDEPVMEAVYTDDVNQIVLKTGGTARRCDLFEMWNRRLNKRSPFASPVQGRPRAGKCPVQRGIGAFPGHQFFFFEEAPDTTSLNEATLVVGDVWGGRLQSIESDDWQPQAVAVEDTTLVVGEDPLMVVAADGTGGRREIPHAAFIRTHR